MGNLPRVCFFKWIPDVIIFLLSCDFYFFSRSFLKTCSSRQLLWDCTVWKAIQKHFGHPWLSGYRKGLTSCFPCELSCTTAHFIRGISWTTGPNKTHDSFRHNKPLCYYNVLTEDCELAAQRERKPSFQATFRSGSIFFLPAGKGKRLTRVYASAETSRRMRTGSSY